MKTNKTRSLRGRSSRCKHRGNGYWKPLLGHSLLARANRRDVTPELGNCGRTSFSMRRGFTPLVVRLAKAAPNV
jgi:hypothetical protein